jgi:hypothetical protein
VVIWIATSMGSEHIAAFTWLNRTTTARGNHRCAPDTGMERLRRSWRIRAAGAVPRVQLTW